MARPDLRLDATARRLGALAVPDGAAWARDARAAALGRLQAMGVPQRRDEYWRFTDPASLIAAEPVPARPMQAEEGAAFGGLDALRLVFTDGRFDAQASAPLEMAGVTIERLADAAVQEGHWAAGLFGSLEAEGQSPVPRPLAALATTFAADGVVIRATGKAPRPIHVCYRHQDTTSDVVLRHLVRVDPGASLQLLESGPAGARATMAMEVDVAEGAAFHHVRAQGRDRERRLATHVFAQVAARAELRSFTLTFNGALTRNEMVVALRGDDGVAHVAGAAVGDGEFHHDDTVFITHDALRCESRQVFKKVLLGGATGVFQGKIKVMPGAQKTDGYQISQALLLDEESRFLAKPELEIYADDVACSHGSTAGALDETALFYLRSRGVPAREATNLLTFAFLREALDEIADQRLVDYLSGRLEGWLSRRG